MADTKQKTIDLILSYLNKYSDFPAISNSITLLNKYKTTEDAAISEFANIILNDFALTSKILKLVNSVYFARIGEITTVSRAIILLGLENVKNIALTLVLFNHFQKHSSHAELADSIIRSLYSARLAQKISETMNLAEKEEAFICALFHKFGKIITTFALPGKIDDIKHYRNVRDVSDDLAALSVLGISYEEIGTTIARQWKLPKKIIQSMHKVSISEIENFPGGTDKLVSISNFSNEVSNILANASERSDADKKIATLIEQFKAHFGASSGKIKPLIDTSLEDLVEYLKIFELDITNVFFVRQLLKIYQPEEIEGLDAEELNQSDEFTSESLMTFDSVIEEKKIETLETIFVKGIQDVNNSIMNRVTLNDIIRIVLETIYRGMRLLGRCRALFFIKNTQLPSMDIRFGLGIDVDKLNEWFTIPLGNQKDIFNISIAKQTDLIIKNIEAPDMRKLVPKWFREKVSPDIFVILLPIVINKKPIGMFYIEAEKSDLQKISGTHLVYLKILRDQAVMAINQIQGY